MTDQFESQLREEILSAIAVNDDPELATRAAERAIEKARRRLRLRKRLTVAASASSVAATILIVGVLTPGSRSGPHDQDPLHQPSTTAPTCIGGPGQPVPPTTVTGTSGDLIPSTTGPVDQDTIPGCDPGPTTSWVGTAPATPTFHS